MKTKILIIILVIFSLTLSNFIYSQTDTSKNKIDTNKHDQSEISYVMIQENPQFPGGDNELLIFLKRNIKYPKLAKENNIQGTLFVEFIVNRDGSIKDVRIRKDTNYIGYGCEEEAIRIVKSMPKWIPGKYSGNNVKAFMVLPITFKLEIQPVKDENNK